MTTTASTRKRITTERGNLCSTISSTLQKGWVGATIGLLLLIAAWAIVGVAPSTRAIVPTPWETVKSVLDEGTTFYIPNLVATLRRAGTGYLWGNVVGLAIASVLLITPRLEELVLQLGVISQCLPITAIGPLVFVLFGGRVTSIFLAALLVFFTTMSGVLLGLRSVSPSLIDMVTAFGGGAFVKLRKLQLIATIPATVTALKVAVPAAILGAIVGEYLGGLDDGVGAAMVASQRNQTPERVWALSVLVGLLSLTGYGLLAWVGRVIAPWSKTNGFNT